MGKAVLVTSCKGGVGKSTVSAGLAVAMAELFAPVCKKKSNSFDDITSINKRILIVDCDFGVRSLDLIMGVENSNIYDVSDVLCENVNINNAIRIIDDRENLGLLAAPMNYVASEFPKDKFRELITNLKNEYEYIILDSAPAHAESFYLAQSVSDMALVVSSSTACSLRAAGKTAAELAKLGCNDVKLVMNMFEPKKILKGEFSGIISSIESASSQLIGIIPYDEKIPKTQENGTVLDFSKDKVSKYFTELAKRVVGFNIPLPKRICGVNTKKLF